MAQPKHTDKALLNWHSAFFEAIQLELAQFSPLLEFHAEIPLNTSPLRIDVLVIKKHTQTPIPKNIAAIFRSVNIIEYKSPGDYVSIEDFYKVYGYACLYASLEHIPITECTISFVESRHPRDLLAHLKEVRGYGVEEGVPGIYTIRGDIIPIQIIESKRLSGVENLWLKDLDDSLEAAGIWEVAMAVKELGKGAKADAYVEVITRANAEKVKEVLEMDKSGDNPIMKMVEMIEQWEDRGRQKGKAEGKAEGKREVAEKLVARGWPPEEVVETTGLDMKTVKGLYLRN